MPVCQDSQGITFKFRKEKHSFLCLTCCPDLFLSDGMCKNVNYTKKHNQRAITQKHCKQLRLYTAHDLYLKHIPINSEDPDEMPHEPAFH